MTYYTYQLRCEDGSLYAGIASDLKRRMQEHFSADPKCAKYTRSHPPKALCAAWESADRNAASRLEYRLKKLPKQKKEILAAGGSLRDVFDGDFAADYRPLSSEEISRCTPF
ncbi:MAG: GIY-YIG nuclease family protein [Clostridia bacterium]|nr:GIY-YIG nuclease family protein [Clostridia bacterium]